MNPKLVIFNPTFEAKGSIDSGLLLGVLEKITQYPQIHNIKQLESFFQNPQGTQVVTLDGNAPLSYPEVLELASTSTVTIQNISLAAIASSGNTVQEVVDSLEI